MIKPKIPQVLVDLSKPKLSPDQKKLFSYLESTNANVFITGKAGTGKSVLLQYFKSHSKKAVVVAAPTGVAALNVGGQTIHSLFKIKPGFIRPDDIQLGFKVKELFEKVDTVVIDEISMVRVDLMDAINIILQKARGNRLPFGGVQMILFGDLFQLPPVVEDPELYRYFIASYGGYYFFNADVWTTTELECYELRTIFRQKDEYFKNILNSIRSGDISSEHLELLNDRCNLAPPPSDTIILATTNHTVNFINQTRLEQLSVPNFEFPASIVGDLEPSSFPTDEKLKLKIGAQVMFIKNDRDKRWVNGTLGRVKKLSSQEITVDVAGTSHIVNQETWNKIRYVYNPETRNLEENIVSSFIQYPLKLAWALTIHKSQGQTYKRVIVDIGSGAFAHGQTYVALSRCESLEGLYLKRPINYTDIQVDPQIINFMSKMNSI